MGAARRRARVGKRSASGLVSAEGVPLHVTASFGVAASEPTTTMSELVEAADEALYRAKRAGKNRVYAGTEQVTQM
jgi:diguanylate cyclase (GGDEF)-like protein